MIGDAARDAGRALARATVGPLPVALADPLRRALSRAGAAGDPGRAHRTVLHALRAGGIPRAVSTFRLTDNPGLRFRAVDSQVLGQLYWSGEQGWEPELLPWWRRSCRNARSVLELGANVGYFSVQGGLAAPDVRYVAVEPHPLSAAVCREHLALNDVGSVEVVEAAAVADPAVSSVRLQVPADQQSTPTVAFLAGDTELPAEMARDVGAALDVTAVDVRRLLDGVDVVKLDVEGQEHALLGAAREHLREQRVTVFVEVLPGTARLRALIADLCTTDGYRCYALSRRGPVQLTPDRLATVRLMDVYGCQDVILSPTDLHA
ncbi:FkbM family methyltransferase [Geodermatophilus sp. YIM 151500]|uniref:FkbM family methyltransferase n=1 Tax=Geodermatophilus sp. YIM 151500 TaxID=2984531 RepID=UPI0021E39C80|nr:FkbM family methyltransferase [Geodermatophilus sp. YIM 151500]MCV2489278.1 FkbM family methyltransferase [Geodermatophilus sp. YIM 151500]